MYRILYNEVLSFGWDNLSVFYSGHPSPGGSIHCTIMYALVLMLTYYWMALLLCDKGYVLSFFY